MPKDEKPKQNFAKYQTAAAPLLRQTAATSGAAVARNGSPPSEGAHVLQRQQEKDREGELFVTCERSRNAARRVGREDLVLCGFRCLAIEENLLDPLKPWCALQPSVSPATDSVVVAQVMLQRPSRLPRGQTVRRTRHGHVILGHDLDEPLGATLRPVPSGDFDAELPMILRDIAVRCLGGTESPAAVRKLQLDLLVANCVVRRPGLPSEMKFGELDPVTCESLVYFRNAVRPVAEPLLAALHSASERVEARLKDAGLRDLLGRVSSSLESPDGDALLREFADRWQSFLERIEVKEWEVLLEPGQLELIEHESEEPLSRRERKLLEMLGKEKARRVALGQKLERLNSRMGSLADQLQQSERTQKALGEEVERARESSEAACNRIARDVSATAEVLNASKYSVESNQQKLNRLEEIQRHLGGVGTPSLLFRVAAPLLKWFLALISLLLVSLALVIRVFRKCVKAVTRQDRPLENPRVRLLGVSMDRPIRRAETLVQSAQSWVQQGASTLGPEKGQNT